MPQRIGHMTIKLLYCVTDKNDKLVERTLKLILEVGFLNRGNLSIHMYKNNCLHKVLVLA